KSSRASRQSAGTDNAVRATVRLSLQVRVVDCVNHRPQHLELERQGLERPPLGLNGRAARHDQREALLAVSRALNETALEVRQRFSIDPRIMLRERRDALTHQVWGEELG